MHADNSIDTDVLWARCARPLSAGRLQCWIAVTHRKLLQTASMGLAMCLVGNSAVAAGQNWTAIAGRGEVCRLARIFLSEGQQVFPPGLTSLLVPQVIADVGRP